MKILSIPPLVHDSSICILENGKIVSYKMEERFSRKKHDSGFTNILDKLILENHTKFDKIIISRCFLEQFCYSTNDIIEKISMIEYDDLIVENHEHHLFHAYCGFYNSNFDHAICFSLDGCGAILDNGYIEIETVYELNKNSGEKEKQLFQKSRGFLQLNPINYQQYYEKITWENLSVGEKFFNKCEKFGYNPIDSAGKVMGLAQYKNYKEKLKYPYNTKKWKENVDEAYEVQQETQNYVLSLIKKYTEETGIYNVVISGGYGLNCVANYHYLKSLKHINFFIDPICFDAGISIGSAYYHYSNNNSKNILPLENVYIGHKEESYDLEGLNTKKVSYEDIVDLIIDKNIVALFQGKSEAGQRSLGNRSLLFDPRVPNGKDIVNNIKKRENFRPFAGSVLLEESVKWFNMLSLKESPYMQYAIDAYEDTVKKVPAIIHADNTCRIQTVSKEQNMHFYNLINAFFDKTNVPILLNTSFNLGGEPLVETFKHAVKTLENSDIEYLYLPEIETLVTVKNSKIKYK